MTHAQIAAEFGVGRSAVSAELSRAGYTNPVRYDDTIPWKVALEHSTDVNLWMLRVAHRIEHSGKVSEDERKRFQSWAAKLAEDDAVIVYVRNSEHGFYRVRRQQGDGQYIRLPQPRVSDNPFTSNLAEAPKLG